MLSPTTHPSGFNAIHSLVIGLQMYITNRMDATPATEKPITRWHDNNFLWKKIQYVILDEWFVLVNRNVCDRSRNTIHIILELLKEKPRRSFSFYPSRKYTQEWRTTNKRIPSFRDTLEEGSFADDRDKTSDEISTWKKGMFLLLPLLAIL